MAANMIEVREFTKRFGDFAAVDGISLDVAEGSIFAFLGPNGAGKSTTINTLCTIQEKTSGELRINGHDVSRQQDLVRRDIGIVFQETTLDTKLTVAENLRLHCAFYRVPQGERAERVRSALDLVDMRDWADSPVGSLSGGMKRRVEIARGLSHFPKVLFLDEPTTGLDPQTRAHVWDCVRRLQATRGTTVFLTTHYMEEAEICDRVAIIDHGRIVAHDTPANLKRAHTSTTFRIHTDFPDDLVRILEEMRLPHTSDGDGVTAHSVDTRDVVQVVQRFGPGIRDLEVAKGTLNDVFIALTGKEIRS